MENYNSNFSEYYGYLDKPLASQTTNAKSWNEYASRGSCLYPQNGLQSSLGCSFGETDSTCDEEVGLSVMAGPKNKIKAELKNIELWNVFREKETEMIITRAGRYVDSYLWLVRKFLLVQSRARIYVMYSGI